MQNIVVCFAISCSTGFVQMPKPVSLVVICRTNRWKIGGDLNLIVFCGSWHWTRIWIVNRRLCPWEASDHNSSFSRAVIFSFSPSCNFIIFSLQTLILWDFDFICPISNIFYPQLSAKTSSGDIIWQLEWSNPSVNLMLNLFLLQILGIFCDCLRFPSFSTNAPFSRRKSSNFLFVIGRIFCGNWHT